MHKLKRSKHMCTMEIIMATGGEAEMLGRPTSMMDTSLDWLEIWMLLQCMGYGAWAFKWRVYRELLFCCSLLTWLGAKSHQGQVLCYAP